MIFYSGWPIIPQILQVFVQVWMLVPILHPDGLCFQVDIIFFELRILYVEDLLLCIVAWANIAETSKMQNPSNFCSWRIPVANAQVNHNP